MRATLLALTTLVLVAGGAASAQAGHGIVGGVYGHVGPRHYSYNRGYYGGAGGYYGASAYRSYHSGGHGHHGHGHHQWHDTSHFDYHPGGYIRHYDHYDYVPSHYDWHREGHWDHH